MELYLNEIYLGGGSYGIRSASLNYFNKSLSDLELDEMAMLQLFQRLLQHIIPIKTQLKL